MDDARAAARIQNHITGGSAGFGRYGEDAFYNFDRNNRSDIPAPRPLFIDSRPADLKLQRKERRETAG